MLVLSESPETHVLFLQNRYSKVHSNINLPLLLVPAHMYLYHDRTLKVRKEFGPYPPSCLYCNEAHCGDFYDKDLYVFGNYTKMHQLIFHKLLNSSHCQPELGFSWQPRGETFCIVFPAPYSFNSFSIL